MGYLHFVVGVCLIIPSIEGFCFSSFGRVDVTATGRRVPICEYNGIDFLDGSKFTTTGCNECECKKGHLHCCGIGVKAGVLTPRPNCKIINDGCIAKEVRISDESLDCITGNPIRNSTDEVTFPTGAPLPPPNAVPTTMDTRGGVAISRIQSSSSGNMSPDSAGAHALQDILNKIATNAQNGKRTTMNDLMQDMSTAKFPTGTNMLDDLMRDMSNAKLPIRSNTVYQQIPQFPQFPTTRSSSSFQLFDPMTSMTSNDPWSNWIMYNGLLDGSF